MPRPSPPHGAATPARPRWRTREALAAVGLAVTLPSDAYMVFLAEIPADRTSPRYAVAHDDSILGGLFGGPHLVMDAWTKVHVATAHTLEEAAEPAPTSSGPRARCDAQVSTSRQGHASPDTAAEATPSLIRTSHRRRPTLSGTKRGRAASSSRPTPDTTRTPFSAGRAAPRRELGCRSDPRAGCCPQRRPPAPLPRPTLPTARHPAIRCSHPVVAVLAAGAAMVGVSAGPR